MSPEILTATTPLGAGPNGEAVPFDVLEADLDGDGVAERVEIETRPRLLGSPFREWRVLRADGALIGVAAGVEVAVERSGAGAALIRSDGAFWTLRPHFGLLPYGDLIEPRTPFMRTGTKEDQRALQANGAPGIFQDNVQVITIDLVGGREAHRVLAGSGFAFMDEASETSPFLITTADHRPLFGGWSGAHPWLFRNGTGFTVVAKSRFGFQISILPEGVL